MNPETDQRTARLALSASVFSLASFLFAVLVLVVKYSVRVSRRLTPTAPPCAPRRWPKSARPKPDRWIIAGWIDQQRGLVRLPIDVAMQIAAQEWQNPAAARRI